MLVVGGLLSVFCAHAFWEPGRNRLFPMDGIC
jgi:hypothetical protein